MKEEFAKSRRQILRRSRGRRKIQDELRAERKNYETIKTSKRALYSTIYFSTNQKNIGLGYYLCLTEFHIILGNHTV
jgi:hypothetical protein